MMLSYILGIIVIITFVIGIIVMNTFLLQQQTVDKVESTRDTEADEDLLSLAKAGSQVVYSEVYLGYLAEVFVQYMLIDMFRELTFAVDYTTLYQFADLSNESITISPARYGSKNVSFDFPTIYYERTLSQGETVLSQKVSRFAYVLPELLKIYKNSAIRYTMYFDTSGFTYFYPGLNITSYDGNSTFWYQEFMKTENLTLTRSYTDSLGNSSNQIISIVVPLYDSYDKTNRIGALCGDWLIKGLYQLLEDLDYLNNTNTYQYLIYKDGTIIDPENKPWINPEITNLANMTYKELWPEILSTPTGTHFMIEQNDVWRIGTASVQNSDNKLNWTFILLLAVKESDVMSYKEKAKNLIQSEGVKFIIITICCSIATSAVVIYFINLQANNISGPIQGIIDFTYKLNSEENNEEVLNELNNLKEGTDQTARLVLAYKELAKSLIHKKGSSQKKHEEQTRIYPANEFYRIDRQVLLSGIELIPVNINPNK
jgi:hypothetical protein